MVDAQVLAGTTEKTVAEDLTSVTNPVRLTVTPKAGTASTVEVVDDQDLDTDGSLTITDDLSDYDVPFALTVAPTNAATLSDTAVDATIVITDTDAQGRVQVDALSFPNASKSDPQTTSKKFIQITDVSVEGWSAGKVTISVSLVAEVTLGDGIEYGRIRIQGRDAHGNGFETGKPHPDTPQSVLEEFGFEVRDYTGDSDETAFNDTWKKLEKRRKDKKKWKTLVIPDPEVGGEVLTFRYREIDPGSSVLTDDIAIITGVIYNAKHERTNDTMVKAQEEGRLEEFLQVQKNNRDWQNKILSLGLEIPIEQVEETITHPIVRARLVYAIRGGAVPRLDTDAQTDVDTFPEPVEGQEPTETASEGGST